MSTINDNNIISILKIGDNYLYKSNLDITNINDDKWSWLLKFAYSFKDEIKVRMIKELENEVREELKEKKQEEKQQEEKQQKEKKQGKRKRIIKQMKRTTISKPMYKKVTDEELIINKIFQNLSMNFPNIEMKYKSSEQKKKYKRELLQAFKEIDKNDDGTIDKEEFVEVYNKMNPENSEKLNLQIHKKKIEELMHSVGDKNKDGKIDKVEFIIYMISEEEEKEKKKK